MGLVYRAEHIERGEQVALKTIPAPAEALLVGIRREIHALGQLRHPGVVRIVAEGVDGGLPWYAMDLLSGRTLRAYLPDPRTVQTEGISAQALAPVLTRLRLLCATLSFVHCHGIVHHDLKPENIFVRDDGLPVLVDFGIATRFSGSGGREALELGAKVEGSDAYMAPEQIRGEVVDARTDLYALGCILYESVTARPPFIPSGAGTVLYQHLHQPALPPSRLVPGISEPLDRLILKLLEKRPQDRIGYADDVAAALIELGANPAGPVLLPDARPYLYRPGIVGRDDVLQATEAALDRLSRGRGGQIFIGGESGVGKTRLAMEVATMAAWNGLSVVTGECIPISADGNGVRGGPLHPFRPLLLAVADRCRERGPEETERLLGPRGKILALYEPTLAGLPGQADQPEPPVLQPEAARDRALHALQETLFAFTRESPVLLVLDDLQWADELSLRLLQELAASGLEERGVLVVSTYRADEMSASELLFMRGLAKVPGGEERARAEAPVLDVVLGRLDSASVGAIVSGMLALPELPQAFIDVLYRQSNGNPFFIGEYLRSAIGSGMLFRDRTGAWRWGELASKAASLEASLAPPHSIAEIIAKRLLALGDDDRALVRLASVLGREFDGDLLMTTAGVDDALWMKALETLRLRQIIEEPAAGKLRFVHDKIREVTYEAIEPRSRRVLHRAAAEALEARGAKPDDLAVLANHWSRADMKGKAREYLGRAGERALRAGAPQQAASLLARALELADAADDAASPRERTGLNQLYAEALWGIGDARSGTHFELSLNLSGVRVPHSKTAMVGVLLREIGEQIARVALPLSGWPPPADEKRMIETAQSAYQLASCYIAAHRPPLRVMMAALLAANLADRAGPRGPRARPYSMLGATAGLMGIAPLARWYFERARQDARHRNDRPEYAATAVMEGVFYQATARWDEHDSLMEEAIAIAAEVQDFHVWETLQLMWVAAALLRGQLTSAAERIEKLRRSAVTRGGRLVHAWSSTLFGLYEFWGGSAEASRELARAARRDFGDDGGLTVANAVGVSAAASFLLGDTTSALREAGEALSLLGRQSPSFFVIHACETTVWTLLALWEDAVRHRRRDAGAIRDKALDACAVQKSFGRQYRIGRSAAFRAAGVAARLDGQPSRARAKLEKAIAQAQAMRMPRAEAHARFELARLEPKGSSRRIEQATFARDEWKQIGCAPWAERAAALLFPDDSDEAHDDRHDPRNVQPAIR